MPEKLMLPLRLAQNLLPLLDGVYVHAEAPLTVPLGTGPYRALIDTGSSHSWVKPNIGDSLQRHSLEGYVVDRGNGTEEDAALDVKFGFMKGFSGKPVRGWVQFDRRLPAYDILLFSGDFGMPDVDLLVGMDIVCSFLQCAVLIRGTQYQPSLNIEY
jgi:hypothetical protein